MRNLKNLSLSCLIAVASLPALAQGGDAPSTAALGAGGEVYRVTAGSYGELFPGGTAFDAAAPVVALDVEVPGKEPERRFVPGTADGRVERDLRLLYDPRSSAPTVVWKSDGAGGATIVRFTTLGVDGWSAVTTLEQDGAPVLMSRDPWIVETRDRFDLELEDGSVLSAERSIVHVVWLDDAGAMLEVRYSPLIFVEGAYIGSHEVFTLTGALLLGIGKQAETALPPALAGALELMPIDDGRALRLAFADASSGRVGAIEIRPLALALEQLGEQVRERVAELSEAYDPADLGPFQDVVRAGIVIIGQRFDMHPAVVEFVSDEVILWIGDNAAAYAGDFDALADQLRDLTVALASSIEASTVVGAVSPGTGFDEVALAQFLSQVEAGPAARILDFRLRSDRPAPAVGDGETMLYASGDGLDLLVAWHDAEAGTVSWTESRQAIAGGAWSETASLALGPDLTLDQARDLLRSRVR